ALRPPLRFGLLIESYRGLRALHSLPTRRSSDLARATHCPGLRRVARASRVRASPRRSRPRWLPNRPVARPWSRASRTWTWRSRRSEEHTSELQSREKLVCRLLLEKKKEAFRAC